METTYYTNFIVNTETNNIIMMMDYPTAAESIRDSIAYGAIEGVHVDRVGPLSHGLMYTDDNEPADQRIAY